MGSCTAVVWEEFERRQCPTLREEQSPLGFQVLELTLFTNSPTGMAPTALTSDEQMTAMEAGNSEMKYQLAKEGISANTQAILFHFGAITLSKFAAFFKDVDEIRIVAKDELGIDPGVGLAKRAELAGLICAWEAAGARTKETIKYMGEMDARKQTKPLLGSDYLVMKTSFEKKFFRLEDQDCPARVYIEKRIAEMESGEMRAEALKTVLNRDQDGEESLVPSWDNVGSLKLKRSVSDIEEPTNPEELRRRISIMINGLIFISLQHTNRQELQGIRPEFANTYASYLLGDQVWAMVAQDENGHTIASPNWRLVLQYEFNLRKKAYREMCEQGTPFVLALREAWDDVLTRNRFFVTPLAIASSSGSKSIEFTTSAQQAVSKRSASDIDGYPAQRAFPVGQKNKAKAKGGKGKGGKRFKGGAGGGKGGLEVPKGCASITPDGKRVCYAYNDFASRCRNPQCAFFSGHVCGICFQKHPMYACQGKQKFQGEKKGPETQGGQ